MSSTSALVRSTTAKALKRSAAARSRLASREDRAERTITVGGVLGGAPSGAAPDGEAQWWSEAFVRQCRAGLDELASFAPWLGQSPLPARLEALVT